MPHLIDTHAHLDDPIFERDLAVVIKQALADDIWIVTLGSDYASSKRAVEIAEQYGQGVYAAIGLHPKRVSQQALADDQLMNLERFAELADHPKVVAIGETGLDYSVLPEGRGKGVREKRELAAENQKQVLSRFLQLAAEKRLPLLLHCREAHNDLLGILERWDKTARPADVSGIVHHYTGNWKQAKRYFTLDFLLSVTGLLTHGGFQAEVFRKAPLDKLVLESDCPHLTTVPWSHRRSEPIYLETVALSLAGLRQRDLLEIAAATTANSRRVLKKMI
jgi:TatD DNase family protein